MSEPFLGEIKMFGFNFPPRNWAFCDGQILPINQNQSLYSLLGTTFGGDGRASFALPDLRGRVPIHEGNGHTLGQRSGEELHALTSNEMPVHNHQARASSGSGDAPIPSNLVLASANNLYRSPDNLTNLRAGTLANTGSNQGHQNMQPYQTLSFCIALSGLFPSLN
jgi:microcystin-dependent protein